MFGGGKNRSVPIHSGVRHFFCQIVSLQGKIIQCNAFSQCVARFFYDFIYRFKKLFDESVSECRIAFGSPYRYKRRLKKANNVSISQVNTSHHYVIYDLSVATEKYSHFCIFDTLHISHNLVTQPVARHETCKTEKVSAASFR
jgi:hypothetical protein